MMDADLKAHLIQQAKDLADAEYRLEPTHDGWKLIIATGNREFLFDKERGLDAKSLRESMASNYAACVCAAFERTWHFKNEVLRAIPLIEKGGLAELSAALDILNALMEPNTEGPHRAH